jgi:hypothetical protein
MGAKRHSEFRRVSPPTGKSLSSARSAKISDGAPAIRSKNMMRRKMRGLPIAKK